MNASNRYPSIGHNSNRRSDTLDHIVDHIQNTGLTPARYRARHQGRYGGHSRSPVHHNPALHCRINRGCKHGASMVQGHETVRAFDIATIDVSLRESRFKTEYWSHSYHRTRHLAGSGAQAENQLRTWKFFPWWGVTFSFVWSAGLEP